MLPIELDHKVLSTVPAPAYKYINSVFQAFQTILSQNIIPYFRNDRGVSLVQLADLRQSIVFSRMEDEENKILLPTLLLRQKRSWTILIHENLLDYLAHILSYRAGVQRAAGAMKERGMLKFSEFLLRHHFEHLVFPNSNELDVIRSDIEFAATWGKKTRKVIMRFWKC